MRQSRSGSRIAWIKGEASELMGETTAIDVAMEAAHPVRVEEYTSLPDTAGRVWASLESLGAPHLRPLNPLQVHRTANARIAMAAWLLRSERLMEMIRILAASRC